MLVYLRALLTLSFVIFLTGCDGTTYPSFDQLLINISESYTGVWYLATAAAYVFGFFFILRAVYLLKVYGDMRTMMSQQANIKGAMLLMFIGVMLIYSPTAYHTMLLTVFNTTETSPLEYEAVTSAWNQQAVFAVYGFVQLIGLISFIRGWVMLSQQGQGGQSQFGKAMTHIIGGLFAINIQGTIDVFKGTLGIS